MDNKGHSLRGVWYEIVHTLDNFFHEISKFLKLEIAKISLFLLVLDSLINRFYLIPLIWHPRTNDIEISSKIMPKKYVHIFKKDTKKIWWKMKNLNLSCLHVKSLPPFFSFTNTLPLHKFISKTEKLYKKDDIRGTKYASNICFYEFWWPLLYAILHKYIRPKITSKIIQFVDNYNSINREERLTLW